MNLWWQDVQSAYGTAVLGAWLFWIVLSITLHELGHGWAAIHSGDRTPIELGHMTWNPLVHIPMGAWVMLFLCGITWGRMPVNPNRFRRHVDEAIVAIAGPLMNLLLVIICLVASGLLFGRGADPQGSGPMDLGLMFARLGAMLNAVLFLFNLLPVPPLDGSRVVATFVRPYREFVYSERGQIAAFIALAILFVFKPFDLFGIAFPMVDRGIVAIGRLVGGGAP